MTERQELTLSQLTALIKETIDITFSEPVWVVAEISRITFRNHVYLELVEKAEGSNIPVAQMRANIWRSYRRAVIDKFELLTEETFREGLKVLVNGFVTFHPRYGLSLDIRDIDPYYTIGDIYRRRQEIINQLKAEGIFDMNRSLSLPLVIQRIAVISSETAAGYEDFVNHLSNNGYGFVFYHKLFRALMQGEQAERSIIDALDRIFREHEQFDAVVIIRGGGSKTDLSVFDSYELAANVAQFPLPVLTGIGHTRDESVVDMVASLSLKTPTAVADFIVERAAEFAGKITLLHDRLTKETMRFIAEQKLELTRLYADLRQYVPSFLWIQRNVLERVNSRLKNTLMMPQREKQRITFLMQRLSLAQKNYLRQSRVQLAEMAKALQQATVRRFDTEKNKLEKIGVKIQSNDPYRIMSLGYSITLHNGKQLRSITQVSGYDTIETLLQDGRIISQVKHTKRN